MLLDHFTRVENGVNAVYHLGNLSKWIAQHTKLDGKPFTYVGHEYQKDIIDDPAKNVYVKKAAQTGLSEIFARWGIAACVTQNNFTLIWTFPSSSDAERFTKARLDPLISSSYEISRSISKMVNSSELKKFGENSFAYIRGTLSETGGLSVPADLLIHDEFDKSDMSNIATYVSRLQHKPTKMRRLFSTPTVSKYGIDLLCETSKRKHQIWKCSHCNHTWIPSYENDVHIPGWNRSKKEINKVNIKDIDWVNAKLLCPSCFKEPDVDVKYREWVVENPTDNYDASSYHVSPFCAPAFITPSYLVKVSTDFDKWSEFTNQSLGLCAEDEQEMMTEAEIRRAFIQAPLADSSPHVMGVDMGLFCYITIGRKTSTGTVVVVHREKVGYTRLEERRRELIRQYKVIVSVHDMFPYTDIVKRITDFDPNAYGAIYVEKASTETSYIKEQEKNDEEGKMNVRTVFVNRNVSLDALMAEFKRGSIIMQDGEDKEEVVQHLKDMKRVQVFDKHGGMIYRWVKTQGNDHYHHSLLYMYTALDLRGTVTATNNTGVLGLVTKFRVKNPY